MEGLLEPGAEIAGYRVESHLGSGGMGHVYRATGPDGRAVALKLYKPKLAGDPSFRKRFERELRVAANVNHANVAATLAHGEHEGMPWMAQVLVEGGSLSQRLKAHGPLSVEETLRVVADVAAGLDALHAAGLVHRDVKPANVFLDGRSEALVGDFGLAKFSEGTVVTAPGTTLGSMDYIPPEQVKGEEVTPASDVYALGCIAYHCLHGAPPFFHLKGMQVLAAHVREPPPPPAPTRPDVSDELRAALLRALEKDPAARPARATEYAELLRAAAGGA